MAKVLTAPSCSLKEFRLLPGFTASNGSTPHVSLRTRLCRSDDEFLDLHIPFISAAMQAVTGTEMAIAIAQLGGIGILPVSQPMEDQCDAIDRVKRFKAGFQTNIKTLSPQQAIADVIDIIEENGYTTFPVTECGQPNGKLLGIITDKDFDVRRDHEKKVVDRMKTDVQTGVEIDDLSQANELMIQYGRGVLPIVSKDGLLQSVVFKKDLDKHLQHPNESIDEKKRLLVGAAISTHPEDRDRVQALVEREVDVLVIDAADGHTHYQKQALGWIKSEFDVPVVGGNVVTAAGFEFLAAAGADAVKIGMGIGSGCTTQEIKATGRGQATALMDIAPARDALAKKEGRYLPLIADGGISTTAEMSVALALGADALMMGNFFARYTESEGNLVRNAAGEIVKEYWMEGSTKARNFRRYAQAKEFFFEEGITGYVPHMGSVYEKLPIILQILGATLATTGCVTMDELHEQAVLEKQSPTALGDSRIHDMVAMNIDQQIL